MKDRDDKGMIYALTDVLIFITGAAIIFSAIVFAG